MIFRIFFTIGNSWGFMNGYLITERRHKISVVLFHFQTAFPSLHRSHTSRTVHVRYSPILWDHIPNSGILLFLFSGMSDPPPAQSPSAYEQYAQYVQYYQQQPPSKASRGISSMSATNELRGKSVPTNENSFFKALFCSIFFDQGNRIPLF